MSSFLQQAFRLKSSESFINREDRYASAFPQGANKSLGPLRLYPHFASQGIGQANDNSFNLPLLRHLQDSLQVLLELDPVEVSRW